MSKHKPPRRGAPIGNQNARKHGYYSKRIRFGRGRRLYYFPDPSRLDLDFRVDIALAKFQSVRSLAPHNIALIRRAYGTLHRLAWEQHNKMQNAEAHSMSSNPPSGQRGVR